MAANTDNVSAATPNVWRDAVSGVGMTVNADGSFNLNEVGTRSIAAGTAATTAAWIPGTIRDPVSGVAMVVNADGSINVATE